MTRTSTLQSWEHKGRTNTKEEQTRIKCWFWSRGFSDATGGLPWGRKSDHLFGLSEGGGLGYGYGVCFGCWGVTDRGTCLSLPPGIGVVCFSFVFTVCMSTRCTRLGESPLLVEANFRCNRCNRVGLSWGEG